MSKRKADNMSEPAAPSVGDWLKALGESSVKHPDYGMTAEEVAVMLCCSIKTAQRRIKGLIGAQKLACNPRGRVIKTVVGVSRVVPTYYLVKK